MNGANFMNGDEPVCKKIIAGVEFDPVLVGSRDMGVVKAFSMVRLCNKICYDSPSNVLLAR